MAEHRQGLGALANSVRSWHDKHELIKGIKAANKIKLKERVHISVSRSFRVTENSSADQPCRIWRCRTPLPAPILEAGKIGTLDCTCCKSASPYHAAVFPCYFLKKKFMYALEDLKVILVKSGANTLCRHKEAEGFVTRVGDEIFIVLCMS